MKKRAHNARAKSARRPSASRIERVSRAPRSGPAAANARTAARPRKAASASTKANARPARASVPASDLALPAECTLADAETLKMRLAALLKNVKPVTVDVRGVRRIDTASIQLLAAFARDRRVGNLAVTMRGESAMFEEAVRLLGLRELLSPPAAAPASEG